MGFFVVFRAIFVRLLFAIHGLLAIWQIYTVTSEPMYWYITLALAGLLGETILTLCKKQGNDWKWFCPSVFFYLLAVVPAIWFLELHQLNRRIELKSQRINVSSRINESEYQDLTAHIQGLGIELRIPIRMSSDEWVRALEQILLLFLILGRWLLPKGKLTHDQLSQLLLVYIGTAADIVEFFEAFKEEKVRYNVILCEVILAIWSWSLLQFTMVLTATKARKDQSGLVHNPMTESSNTCCTPDVYGIVISIMMQDAPFLVLRLMLIIKYGVFSYTNMFFTCKNTLVILLLMYRLVVVQIQRRQAQAMSDKYMTMSESSSRVRLVVPGQVPPGEPYCIYKPTANNLSPRHVGKPRPKPKTALTGNSEPKYIIKRHHSRGDVIGNITTDDEDPDGTPRPKLHRKIRAQDGIGSLEKKVTLVVDEDTDYNVLTDDNAETEDYDLTEQESDAECVDEKNEHSLV